MYGKNKFSLAEKKLIRVVIVLTLIQLVVIFTFAHTWIRSQQIDINDTKQIDITVDDIYYFRVPREYWLIVVSDSTEYLFKSRSTFDEFSVNELYESIGVGTRLSLMYQETLTVLGNVNLVVDARSGINTYRSIEEFNYGKHGVRPFLTITFSIIEFIFIGIVLVYAWLNYTTIKGVYQKAKKHLSQLKD